MVAVDKDAGPPACTEVSSLTEMVSLVTGESGSGVVGAAAGRQRRMSRLDDISVDSA